MFAAFTDTRTIRAMVGPQESTSKDVLTAVRDFMRLESSGGILLLAATVIAMAIANSPLANLYDSLLDTTVAVQVGALSIQKPLVLWVNDGLMAIFFFVIGLEIKREVLDGELSSPSQIVLPAIGALGGMAIPAAIYMGFNWGNAAALDGWAIPVATDIAFALALLSVFGRRVPMALRVFLLSLAIFDDLAAIVIIAIFYSGDLSIGALVTGAMALLTAIFMNKVGVTKVAAYVLVGVVLWVAVLKSGVHATLAGVLIALCIPIRGPNDRSPLREIENDLHGPVALAILPIFAFANAGLSLSGMSAQDFIHPVTLGVIFGLVIGKPLGIVLFAALAVGLGLVRLPAGLTWPRLLGVAFACGIGFTMSLFIAGLAFEHGNGDYFRGDRLGILIGSGLSAIVAYALLHLALPQGPNNADSDSML